MSSRAEQIAFERSYRVSAANLKRAQAAVIEARNAAASTHRPTPCQCLFETASLQVADGELRGYLLCAVSNRPKACAEADALLAYPEAATALGLPESILRTLVSAGSIEPTVRRGSFVRLIPSHIRAQLSQKGIKR